MKYIFIFLTILILSPISYGQSTYNQGKTAEGRKVVPWHSVIESDVAYHWRVERIIDTRIKQNTPMQAPVNPLWKIIQTALENNTLLAYKSDSLTIPYNLEQISLRLNREVNIQIAQDPEDPYNIKDSTVFQTFDWAEFRKFRIMEDWIYDKKDGRMYCRIVYIAPLFRPYAGPGVTVPEQPAFYLKYYDPSNRDPTCFRNVAVNKMIFNPKNDGKRLTYDDFFEMRMYDGFIIKESNLFDNRFKDYDEHSNDPILIMLAGEKAHQQLMEKEMDWYEH